MITYTYRVGVVMIELKNIKKLYKSRKGLSTLALDDITLKLNDKGLVFILGKSGSGKSTLLNIIGGLDSYTSGDILIDGTSTKNFKEKDWDAYRNTYTAFIFQEFNLLDNYNIEDNIKLSLKLQHKKATKGQIVKALEEVELPDILKRKPNELSGGQKQRVAIARTLIKDSKIILADEPTGNLDSKTSKQIFDILKKISKEKLVVIVSHDEESTLKYADRIIRIKDGKIESDDGKEQKPKNEKLTLRSAHLPMFYNLKMGIGNLFHKKFRLILSILLIVLCLVCFSLTISVFNQDITKEYIKQFEEVGESEVYIQKYAQKVEYKKIYTKEIQQIFKGNEESEELSPTPLNFSKDTTLEKEAEEKTNMSWHKEYTITNDFGTLNWIYNKATSTNDAIYNYYVARFVVEMNFVEIDDTLKEELNIIGDIPKQDDEIVISSMIADQIIQYGINIKNKTTGKVEVYNPTTYDQIIKDDVYINLGDYTYVKVVGIVDYTEYLKKFTDSKKITWATYSDMNAEEKLNMTTLYTQILGDEFLQRVYVSTSFIEKVEKDEETKSNEETKIIYNNKTYDIEQFGYLNKEVSIYGNDINKVSALNENEIIINLATLNTMTNGDFEVSLEEALVKGMSQKEFVTKYIKDKNIINQTIKTSIKNNKIYQDSTNFSEYKIIGVIDDNSEDSLIYYNKENIINLIEDRIYSDSIYTNVTRVEDLETILKYYPIDNSDTISGSSISKNLLTGIECAYIFKALCKYGVYFFIILSILILMNFINTSIRFRKKEIGILRALGCRSIDVLKMFLYECLLFIFICLLISIPIIFKLENAINNAVIEWFLINIKIINFGPTQIALTALVMTFLVVISAIIPIRKLTKKKPIDTILDK
jgi:ABC-type lipoprotein export system ATPase subunit/ABC-type lipoprotein release transport system permease subunit